MRALFKNAALAAGVVATALSGCYDGPADIDRTQGNKVEKSIFEGEWYFRPTVVEVQFSQGMLFEGYEGSTERIRWEIREHHLEAFRSYETFIGAEEGNGEPEFQGAPVARFPILGHFDVARGYDKATGEQTNVLEENTTDRPWYERDYMRVDWSTNDLDNPYALEEFVEAYAGAPFYIQPSDVESPWRPEITEENINVVGQYVLEPDPWTCWGLFQDPTFCGNTHAKMKLSFKKIHGTRTTPDGRNILADYEPMFYPDLIPVTDDDGHQVYSECYTDGTCQKATIQVFERFGFFRHERIAYDDEFGWTRDGRVFLGHRHNMWKRSYDAAGNLIPPEFRDTKKIVYYTNEDFPADADAWAATYAIAADWNRAFKETLLGIRRQRNPELTMEDIEDIFEVRENSCNIADLGNFVDKYGLRGELEAVGITELAKGNIKRACAVVEYHTQGTPNAFTWEKFGDLRYSFFNWVDRPMAAGPLGYGPSSADPVTGEIIAGTANLYGASVDTYAAYAADVVSLMNGKLELDTVMTGAHIRAHIAETRQIANRAISNFKMDQFHERMFDEREGFFQGKVPEARAAMYDRRRLEGMPITADTTQDERFRATDTNAALRSLIGTPIEKELLTNDEMRRAMLGSQQFQPGQTDGAELSPIDFMTGSGISEFEDARRRLAMRNIEMMDLNDFSDPGMASLAKELEELDWQGVYTFMRREIYQSVMAHEVGHTLGLRHNFSASFDALNYDPKFWESWDPTTGKVVYRDADNNDAPTPAERYKYASIMDYDARFYADSGEGIGAYDRAAIKFGYGELIEVFKDANTAFLFENFLFFNDYHDIPKMLGGTAPCNGEGQCNTSLESGADLIEWNNNAIQADDLEVQAENALEAGDFDAWAELAHSASIKNEEADRFINSYFLHAMEETNVPAKCTAQNKWCGIWDREEITLKQLRQLWTDYYMDRGYNIPPVVPYDFCPDEIAGYSWVRCQLYDKGATYREVTADRMERYDAYYPFTNFKMDKANFGDATLNGYISRMYDRYFAQMSNVYRYALYSEGSMGRDKDGRELTLADFPVGRDWQEAGVEGLNFLTQIIEQPEPGFYCLSQQNDYRLLNAGDTCTGPVDEYCQRDDVDGEFWPLGAGETCVSGVTRSYCQSSSQVYTPAGEFTDFAGGATPTCQVLPGETTARDPIRVEPGTGKWIDSNWSNEYFYKSTRIGTFWDKYAALFAITDNEGFFFRDFSSYFDAGAFQLSYWSGGLVDEMLELFSTAFQGGTGRFAWRYEEAANGQPRIRPAPVVDIYADSPSYDAPRIQAGTSYTLQWYGVILPIAKFNSAFDYTADFLNYSRICLEGYVDCMTFDETEPGVSPVVEYTDPLTGYVYVAARSDRPETAVAPRILQQAEEFKLREFLPAKRAYEQDPTNETLRLRYERAEAQLNQTSAFLDVTRDVAAAMGGAWR